MGLQKRIDDTTCVTKIGIADPAKRTPCGLNPRQLLLNLLLHSSRLTAVALFSRASNALPPLLVGLHRSDCFERERLTR